MVRELLVEHSALLSTGDANTRRRGAHVSTAAAATTTTTTKATATASTTSTKAASAGRRRKRKPPAMSTAATTHTIDPVAASDPIATTAPPHSLSSDEEKKEKNRNSVKRSYYRKIETLGELRIHADDLRQQYSAMLTRWETRFLPLSDHRIIDAAVDEKDPTKSALLLRYMELSRVRDELWRENQQLQGTFDDREKSAFRLQRLFDVNYQLMDHSAHASNRNPETVRFPSPVIIMDEMSHDAFVGFAADAVAQVDDFVAKRREMTARNQVRGWTSSHVVENDLFRFYFEKHFRIEKSNFDLPSQNSTAASVGATAWAILTSPTRHSELYARTLHVRFHIMQRFGPDELVLYRTMEKEGEDSITTALICMTRVPRGERGGCLIICKGLKKAEHQLTIESMSEYTLHKKKIWRESMYWLSVDETSESESDRESDSDGMKREQDHAARGRRQTQRPRRLRIAHGGIMKHMGDRSPSFWLFENLLIALRWENKLGLESPTVDDRHADVDAATAAAMYEPLQYDSGVRL